MTNRKSLMKYRTEFGIEYNQRKIIILNKVEVYNLCSKGPERKLESGIYTEIEKFKIYSFLPVPQHK